MKPWKIIVTSVAIAWAGNWLYDAARNEASREGAEQCERANGRLMLSHDRRWYCVHNNALFSNSQMEAIEEATGD